jgi:hypothetical protein
MVNTKATQTKIIASCHEYMCEICFPVSLSVMNLMRLGLSQVQELQVVRMLFTCLVKRVMQFSIMANSRPTMTCLVSCAGLFHYVEE